MAEWSDISKWQARRLNPFRGSWDPANWDTSRIDFDKLVAEAEMVVIRIGDGLNLDPCFTRYREALRTRRALWAIYHFHRPSIPPGMQVEFCLLNQAECPPGGVWGDLEVTEGGRGEIYRNTTDLYLRGLDQAYGNPTGIYSGAGHLNGALSRAQQQGWVGRKVWWAAYPGLVIPWGWAEADPPYHVHQYTDRRPWPGLPSPADASRRNPRVPLASLLPGGTMPPPPDDGGERAEIAAKAERIRSLMGG